MLKHKHNGLSKDINRARPEAEAQIVRTAKWRPAHKSGIDQAAYQANVPISWKRANANKQMDAIKRIKEAVRQFLKGGLCFSIRGLIDAAKTSQKTLYKHRQLWKEVQQKLNRDFFAAVSHKYNAVEGGVASENPPPSDQFSENIAPGRLAARRIVFEIARRAKREQRLSSSVRHNEHLSWKASVQNATPKDLLTFRVEQLNASVVVLSHLRMLAPTHEDFVYIQTAIGHIRSELEQRQWRRDISPP